MTNRLVATLKAPTLAVMAQILPMPAEDVVLVGIGAQLWLRDIVKLLGETHRASRRRTVALVAVFAVPIAAAPQPTISISLLAPPAQNQLRAGSDRDFPATSATQRG